MGWCPIRFTNGVIDPRDDKKLQTADPGSARILTQALHLARASAAASEASLRSNWDGNAQTDRRDFFR